MPPGEDSDNVAPDDEEVTRGDSDDFKPLHWHGKACVFTELSGTALSCYSTALPIKRNKMNQITTKENNFYKTAP